jgi:peroxiredoxin
MSDVFDLIVGSPAPEFSLPASTGTEIALTDFHSKNNVYLFFVREFN